MIQYYITNFIIMKERYIDMNFLGQIVPIKCYLDPSAASILVTSITGIAIAVGATVVILVRKAKKKVAKALHIDENANKEVEDDIVINDTDSNS